MNRSIKSFINTEYKTYSKYVLYNRAIPNIIDGLKPSQRKLLFTALKHCKTSHLKTAALVGYTMAESGYHHGDASLASAINLMTQGFTGSNNIGIFKGKGNFGNRLITECAAGRYTSVKINPQFLGFFKDFNILANSLDPENPEPRNYLPIIPWVLVNGIRGIAVGFSTNILPRNPDNLKKVILQLMDKKPPDKKLLYPYFKGFNGKIFKEENSWVTQGVIKHLKKNWWEISELPIGYDRERFITILEKLIENKKIKNYEDFSSDTFSFQIQFLNEISQEHAINVLKLQTKFTENLVVISEEGELKIFDEPLELIYHFIKYRTKKYKERIENEISDLKDKIGFINEIKQFIALVESKKIILSKIAKVDLIGFLNKKGFKYAQKIIELPIYRLTQLELKKQLEEEEKINNRLVYLHKTDAVTEWKKDLSEVK